MHTYPHYRFELRIQPSDVAIPDPLKENLDYVTERLLANGHETEAYEVARYMTGVREKLTTAQLDLGLHYAVNDYTSVFWAVTLMHKLQAHRATHTMTFSLTLQVEQDFDIVLSNPDFFPS